MTAFVHLVLFISIAIIFAIVGFRACRYQHSARDYFRNPSLWKNAVSLTATNITLGTGLVYLVSGAQQLGTLMLIAPWALFVGYAALGLLVEKSANAGIGQGRNLLADVTDRIAAATGKPCQFAKVISGVLTSLLVALLAFEIFASAKVIAPVLIPGSGLHFEITLSIIIFTITLLYTILGGIRAVLAVDFLQVPLILLFLPAFAWVGLFGDNSHVSVTTELINKLDFSTPVLLAVGGAAINAFAGQFFSLLNIGAISQVVARERRQLANRVGFLTAITLSLFVLVGLCVEAGAGISPWAALMSRFEVIAQSGGWGLVISSLVILGMTSILLTTTDAVVFSAIWFWYDNVAGRDSTSALENRTELNHIRKIGTAVFVVSFSLIAILNYFQPDPFYFLLGLAGGVSVLAPAITLALILGQKARTAAAFTPTVFSGFLIILAISCLGNAILVIRQYTWVATLTNIMFAVSTVFAVGVWCKATLAASKPID